MMKIPEYNIQLYFGFVLIFSVNETSDNKKKGNQCVLYIFTDAIALNKNSAKNDNNFFVARNQRTKMFYLLFLTK